jgi:hypothetical protein
LTSKADPYILSRRFKERFLLMPPDFSSVPKAIALLAVSCLLLGAVLFGVLTKLGLGAFLFCTLALLGVGYGLFKVLLS